MTAIGQPSRNRARRKEKFHATTKRHNKKTITFLIALLLTLSHLCDAVSHVDNGVVGSPIVECERDSIRFRVPTRNRFSGRVYVKGEFTNKNCVRSYSDEDGYEESVETGASRHSSSQRFSSSKSSSMGAIDAGNRERNGESPRDSDKDPIVVSEPGSKTQAKIVDGVSSEASRARTTPSVTIFDNERKRKHNGNGVNARNSAAGGTPPTSTAQRVILGASAPPTKNRAGQLAGEPHAANWRGFLRGRPDASDGQGLRRHGSRVSPDEKGECPLVCPPCEDCRERQHHRDHDSSLIIDAQRRRRTVDAHNNADNSHDDHDDADYNDGVRWDYGSDANAHIAELEVPLSACNARRDRTANPPGVHVSFTVLVSFHKNFITKVDRAYHVECAYEESDRTVTTQIDISHPTPINVSGVVEPPHCRYNIRFARDRVDDADAADDDAQPIKARNVRVGDRVRHEWTCRRNHEDIDATGTTANEADAHLATAFGFLVHDCYVDDGRGRREPVIDQHGCSLSPLILPTPRYATHRLSADVDALVAKFPDRDLLGFQCAITVCIRGTGDCERITPPICDDTLTPSPPRAPSKATAARARRSAARHAADWQLNAPLLTVFDADDRHASEFQNLLASIARSSSLNASAEARLVRDDDDADTDAPNSSFCVSVAAFGALVAASTFLVTASLGAFFALFFLDVRCRRNRDR